MVPGSLGCGSAVLAATTMLAPSRAARRALARPMPREAPVMKRVLPASELSMAVSGDRGAGSIPGPDDNHHWTRDPRASTVRPSAPELPMATLLPFPVQPAVP